MSRAGATDQVGITVLPISGQVTWRAGCGAGSRLQDYDRSSRRDKWADPLHGRVMPRSISLKKLFNGKPDIPGNLAQQRGGNVPASVERYRGTPTVGMTVLAMGTALANLMKAELHEVRGDLSRF